MTLFLLICEENCFLRTSHSPKSAAEKSAANFTLVWRTSSHCLSFIITFSVRFTVRLSVRFNVRFSIKFSVRI